MSPATLPTTSDALAGFYWGTMLPCVVERTTAAEYADADGYVTSTLADMYAGTYPMSTTSSRSRAGWRWGAGSTGRWSGG